MAHISEVSCVAIPSIFVWRGGGLRAAPYVGLVCARAKAALAMLGCHPPSSSFSAEQQLTGSPC